MTSALKSPPTSLKEPETVIQTINLAKTYYTAAGPVPVLHDVNFTLKQGEFVAIMGPSGSGKSTFMNILGGLDQPTGGQYLLLGQPMESLPPDDMARLRNRFLGFVFQSFNLLPRIDLVDNVALPLLYAGTSTKERRGRARDLLEKVGLGQHGHHQPNQVSGGQQQRAAIARALVGSPSLILADEPTGNLDSRTTEDILNLFCSLNDEGLTMVLVTHEPEVAGYAKRLVRFNDGHLAEDELVENRRWKKNR